MAEPTATRTTRRASSAAIQMGHGHLTHDQRQALGKAARVNAPLDSHAHFVPDPKRDPVGLLLGQATSRVPELVPVRHGRMLVSPFAFYRGAALPMAADLADTPTSGIRVQLCGDAHLSNFGAFASPERRLVFDLNDFDETLPGPFEWDVKRLAASLAVAGRENSFPRPKRRKVILSAMTAYRTAMRDFATRSMLDVWYSHLNLDEVLQEFRSEIKASRYKATEATIAKAHTRDSTQALNKLTTLIDGQRRIVSTPPLIVPIEEIFADVQAEAVYETIRSLIAKYRRTLQSDRRHLLDQYDVAQVARKVVGVGSVGTRAWVLLMVGSGGTEPLFLQAKEAQASVLSSYAGKSKHSNQGERVVSGQHLMQATSDIFLGWQRTKGQDGIDRDYYVRQLRDWKVSAEIEVMAPAGMAVYARLCGWTLARAHARSGDRVAIASYLGNSEKFDNALADFAELYADQNQLDYGALEAAVAAGRAEAHHGL
jgi:uncharacterized protein (DUF2252 family)